MTINHAVRVAHWPRPISLIAWKYMLVRVVIRLPNGCQGAFELTVKPFDVVDLRQQWFAAASANGFALNCVQSVEFCRFTNFFRNPG